MSDCGVIADSAGDGEGMKGVGVEEISFKPFKGLTGKELMPVELQPVTSISENKNVQNFLICLRINYLYDVMTAASRNQGSIAVRLRQIHEKLHSSQ